jgi:predicted aminopeptidase
MRIPEGSKSLSIRRRVITAVLVVAVMATAGCAQTGYYLQAVGGHLDLMSRRTSIETLVDQPGTSADLRARLATALEIRDFATDELGLPDNGSYRSYADLERSYVVWNVFAAPAFSLDPKVWCFPFVGCVAYRGYFSEDEARSYADGLADEGLDVYVAGIAAYSTLGRFSDPVLNSMMASGDGLLAGLIFHELAHQRLYIEDDSTFNESFASLVEEEGVRRWLRRRGDDKAWTRWLTQRERKRQFNALVTAAIAELRELYQSELSPDLMREGKREVIMAMRAGHARLRAQWGGGSPYDAWFGEPLNNAQLSSVATYRELVPAFRILLEDSGGDLEVFYRRAAAIGALAVEERGQVMRDLTRRAENGRHRAGP